jgi:phospholipid/cholesterol/gamma-HCH transport system substrate-binding protein
MEPRINYAQVGLFVVITTIILIVGGIWLGFGLHTTSYTTYLVYMRESVAGLSVRAPVKYNGVEVGYVNSINLRDDHPDQVALLLDIKSTTPVSIETRAVLNSQGLTGIAYLGLTGGTPNSPPLKAQHGQPYPVIPSSPSLYFRLDAALDDLTTNLNNISDGLTAILNEENAKAIHQTLINVQSVSQTLNQNTQKFDAIINNTNITMKNTAVASERLPNMMSSIQDSARSVKVFAQQLADVGQRANGVLRNAQTSVETLNNQLLPEAVNSLGNFQGLMSNLNSVSQELKQNPSILVRGRSPAAPGPGEK